MCWENRAIRDMEVHRKNKGQETNKKYLNKINQSVIIAAKAITPGDRIQPPWGCGRGIFEAKWAGKAPWRKTHEKQWSALYVSGRGTEKHPERGNSKHKITEGQIILASSKKRKQTNREKQASPGHVGLNEMCI